MQIFGSKKFALTLWAFALGLAMTAKAEDAILMASPPGMPPVVMTEQRLKFFMSKPGFSGMIGAVARVNKAMRVAAENPMDEWRRIDVRNAIAAMPGAITGLAGEFMQGNLHDGDFSAVQSMLGGFVDVSAADAYNKFLQKPDASLIPKAGADFPGGLEQGPVASGSVSMEDNGSAVGDLKSGPTGSSSGELVDLGGSDLGALTREVSGSQGSNKLIFDDSAKKEGSGSDQAATNAASDSFLVQAVAQAAGGEGEKKDSFLNEISRDLAAVEGQDGKKKCTPEQEEAGECEEKEDDEYFRLDADKKKKKRATDSSAKEKVSEKEKKARLKGQKFSLNKKAKPWRAVSNWSTLLLPQPALALNPTDVCLACLQNQGSLGQNENEAVDTCLQQQLCTMDQINAGRFGGNPNGGGGGGMSGGGGGGGQGAGIAALGAIASSIGGAAAQIATVSAAASADKFKAAAAAGAAVGQTAIQADATMHISDNQTAINGATVETAKDIILRREAAGLQNEKMTLAAFANSQDLNRADAREDRKLANYKADKEFELSLYAMRGQFALQSYNLRAQAYTNAMNGGIVGPPTALSPSYAPFGASLGSGGATTFGGMGLMSRSGASAGLPSMLGASSPSARMGVMNRRRSPGQVMRGSTQRKRFVSRSPAVLPPGRLPTMQLQSTTAAGHRDTPISRSTSSAPGRAVVYSFRDRPDAASTGRPIK